MSKRRFEALAGLISRAGNVDASHKKDVAVNLKPFLACRQGDPGSTRFFLSLEDPLFRVFGGERIQGMMKMFQIEDLPIESGMLTNALNEAQRKVLNINTE